MPPRFSRRLVPLAVASAASLVAAFGLSVYSASPAQAALPGTPGLLAGSKLMPDGGVTTAVENADGTRLVLDQSLGGGTDQGSGTAWSPDGKRIAFTNGYPALETISPSATQIHSSDAFAFDPAYTADGATIIEAAWVNDDPDFQLMATPADWTATTDQPDNQTPWFATPTAGSDRFPTVTTTGTVYFEHDATGGGNSKDIWTDHGTHTAGLLISNGQQPDISPDGSTLAFVRSVGGFDQIFTQAADGSGSATPITSGSINHDSPKWAPNGLALDYDANPGTDYTKTTGRHLVLATGTDTLIPNGLFSVVEQPTAPTTLGQTSTFHATGPTRLLDTRNGTGTVAKGAVAANGTLPLLVEGAAGVPAAGVTAVVLNVTVTAPTAAGVLAAYPEGSAAPASSNLNWSAGETIANQVIVPVGADGEVDLLNHSNGTTQVVADVSGYYTAGGTGQAFTAAGPARLLDTRAANGVSTRTPVPANGRVSLQVAGRGGLPVSGVTAVVLNVTATHTTAAGYASVYPDGSTPATASSLNWTPGETIANHVLVPVGADGKVDLVNHSGGTVAFVADTFGYFSTAGTTAGYHTTVPTRLMDTRQGSPIAGGGTRSLDLAGTVVPDGATAVVLNVTVTRTGAPGYLTVYPDGTPLPTSSNLNWTAGQTIPNLVTLPVVDGKIDFHNVSTAGTDVIADVFGYYGG